MIKIACLIFLLAVFLACSPHKTPPSLLEEYFLEKDSGSGVLSVESEIDSLKKETLRRPGNIEARRRLAVCYRMIDTPYHRNLSMKEIDRAIRLQPDNPRLYEEKGLTLMARRFYPEAAKTFKKVLALDHSSRTAFFWLGRLEKMKYMKSMCYPVHLERAAEYFEKAVGIDGRNFQFLTELIFIYLLMEKYERCEDYIRYAIEAFKDSARIYPLLGSLKLATFDFEASESAFEKALKSMPREELHWYYDISPLLREDEKVRYEAMSEKAKLDYIKRFWLKRDPTPATSVNERLLEHYRRVFYSLKLFSDPRLGHEGPETDRGRAMISYGMPDIITMPFKQWTEATGQVIAWKYYYPDGRVTLYYMDEFLNGDFHIPINPQFKAMAYYTMTTEDVVPEAYLYPVEYRSFPVEIGMVQMRGPDDMTELRVTASIPDSVAVSSIDDFTVSYSILDSSGSRILEAKEIIQTDTLSNVSKLNYIYYISRHQIASLPRALNCRLYVSIENLKSGIKGESGLEFRFSDFSRNSLMLSGLSVSLSSGCTACDPWPDPLQIYPSGSSMCLSYEVYNLKTGLSNQSSYTLTYTIVSLDSKRSSSILRTVIPFRRENGASESERLISNSIRQGSRGNHVKDRLILDISSLEEGKYVLWVEIFDELESKSVRRKTSFIVE